MVIDLRVSAGKSLEDMTICNLYTPSMHGNPEHIVDNFWKDWKMK
jgi:hypothetical protein